MGVKNTASRQTADLQNPQEKLQEIWASIAAKRNFAFGTLREQKAHLGMFLRYCVITQDEDDLRNPFKPLPLDAKPYLEDVAELWLENRRMLIAKSRQVMMTWLFAAIFLWDAMFREGRLNVVVSRKEEDADKILKRIKTIYINLPQVLKDFAPTKKSPGNELGSYCRLEFKNGSVIEGLSQDPNAIRSRTASNIFSDEMAFQERARDTYVAMRPSLGRKGKFVGVSTPNGKEFFYKLFHDSGNKPEVVLTKTGFEVLRNTGNEFFRIKLHYSADKSKDANWKKEEEKGISKDAWQQEQEINFTRAGGRQMFPDFSNETHVKDLKAVSHRKLFIGIDFGYHHPAMVITQMNDRDQLCILDEYMPTDVTIDEFAREMLFLLKKNYRWHYENRHNYISWFCDPAGTQVNDKSEFTSVQILRQKYRIFCRYKRVGKLQGIRIIQRLLLRRSDMTPGLVIDRARCPILIEGFGGGYEELETKDNAQSKELPKDDDYYSHTQDALRYIVIHKFKEFGRPYKPKNPDAQDDFEPLEDYRVMDISRAKQATGYY